MSPASWQSWPPTKQTVGTRCEAAGLQRVPHIPITKRGRSTHAPWTRGVPPRGPPEWAAGRHQGVTRQALILDVKEALVDEFVDAEGA
jgi:hypothetical protein